MLSRKEYEHWIFSMAKGLGEVHYLISSPAWVPGSVTIVFLMSHGSIDSLECRDPVHTHGWGPVC